MATQNLSPVTLFDSKSIGVCVGRFQTNKLHEGHKAVIDQVLSHQTGIIFIGVAATPVTKENPLDFLTRKMMIEEYVFHATGMSHGTNVTILPIHDCKHDTTWSENLDKMIKSFTLPFHKVVMYHSRDSFKSRYHGGYPTVCLDEVGTDLNATSIRKAIGSGAPVSSQDFRTGVIFASQNMFPRVQPVVDVAVVDVPRNLLLLGRKPGYKSYCFIGGFIDMHDESALDAAARELREETGLSRLDGILKEDFHFVSSRKVPDWRDTSSTSMLTTFYVVDVGSKKMQPVASDDIEEVRWCNIDCIGNNCEVRLITEHEVLLKDLKKWLGR